VQRAVDREDQERVRGQEAQREAAGREKSRRHVAIRGDLGPRAGVRREEEHREDRERDQDRRDPARAARDGRRENGVEHGA
jgi:hypothetical protein